MSDKVLHLGSSRWWFFKPVSACLDLSVVLLLSLHSSERSYPFSAIVYAGDNEHVGSLVFGLRSCRWYCLRTAMSAAASSSDAGSAAAAPGLASSAPAVVVAAGGPLATMGLGAGADGKEGLQAIIARMKAEQAELRKARKTVTKSLKNCQRRAARLKRRARQLTDSDLVEVLRMRSDTAAANRGAEDAAPPADAPAAAAAEVMGEEP